MASDWFSIAMVSLLVFGAAGAAARAARSGAREQDEVERIWHELAQELGAVLEVAGRVLLTPRHLSLIWIADEAVGRIDAKVPLDLRAPSHTRATAAYVLGSGPMFRLAPRSEIDSAGAEAEVFADHAVLRARMQLWTEVPAAVGRAFGPAVRELVATFPRRFVLRSDGASIDFSWDGTETDPEVLADALTLVTELARVGVADLRALAELDGAEYDPEALDAKGRRRPVVRVRRDGARIELCGQGAGVVARAIPRRPFPAFRARVERDGTVHGRIPEGIVPADAALHLASLGPATITAGAERLEIAWPDVPSVARADRAVRLLAPLAQGSTDGAFR